MSIPFNEVEEYARRASPNECAELALKYTEAARIFKEYSQIPLAFRGVGDQFKALNAKQKKFALESMESSLHMYAKLTP